MSRLIAADWRLQGRKGKEVRQTERRPRLR